PVIFESKDVGFWNTCLYFNHARSILVDCCCFVVLPPGLAKISKVRHIIIGDKANLQPSKIHGRQNKKPQNEIYFFFFLHHMFPLLI
ncbi:hypothetical protein ACJX0J_016106, partial [Zea mays]